MQKVILITGSTSGIGKATATELARQGCKVIIHGRNEGSCKAIVDEITQLTGNKAVFYVTGDLSSMPQVKAMADRLIANHPDINVLINNAGTFSNTRVITPEGFERTWAVNYLSRFLLSHLLLDTLKKNSPSRIIDVSGTYHSKGVIHFDDINLFKNYSLATANNQSKLANVLFTYKMARMLSGSKVTINTLHPGAVNTGSVLRSDDFSAFSKWMYRLFSPFFKSPEQGAVTSVFLATSSEVEGVTGKYFVNKKAVKSSKASYDEGLQDRLWVICPSCTIYQI